MAVTASALPTLLTIFFYGMWGQQNILLIALALSPVLMLAMLLLYKRVKIPGKIDERLVSLILHMYVVSLGEASPDDLIRLIAETKDYGYYSGIFARIRDLAKKFGYGFTKATAKVAAMTKPPLKDILVRCQQVFSSVNPRSYLEIETSMIMEEYSGYYERSVKIMEIFGGIYTTFQSIAIFVLMVVVLMVVFANAPNMIFYAYALAPLMLMVMLIAFKVTAPKERFAYIDGEMRLKTYRMFRVLLLMFPAFALMSFIIGLNVGMPIALALTGLGALAPGLAAYLFERSIHKIDENYPTLIKSLGENISSTSSLKSALYHVLHLELGPLKRLVKRAYSRLKIGVGNEKVMRLFSAEAASYRVYLINKMFLDSFAYGANPIDASKVLGNSCVRFLDLRKRRLMVARSLESVVYLLQPMSTSLLVILAFLSKYFSQSLSSLPFFIFGQIPAEIVEIGNIFVIMAMALISSLILKVCKGGFWGTLFLYLGILLILSAISWIGTEMLMGTMFGDIMKSFEEIISI